MKLNNKENPVITREENNKYPEKMSTCVKHEENEERSVTDNNNGAEKFLPDNDKDDEDDVFEVKMRKNRKSSNRSQNCGGDGIRNNSVTSSSSFLNSRTYSSSTLSLNKGSIFPTSRKKDSISMSLSRGGGSDGEDNVKITGYLEKRSKLLGWKKFWFVLDGRLLAYYKSKSDYDGLSVCCGSINLGIASTVRPIQIRGCKGYPIQIVTRSQVYYLKSPDKQILEQWLLAIQEAASSLPSKISLPVFCDPGSQFYRYSFAASSQWSLNTSCDDITETLSKLPPNFYLKGADPVRNLPQNNNLQKCHSFASLQSPSLYSTMSTTYKDKLNNNSSMKKKKPVALEADDVSKIAGKYPAGCQNQQQSSAAGALKEELVRKLSTISVGKTGERETVKPSTVLTKPKAKSELPFLINPHQGEPHYYDEIVDFEAIYENFEPSSDSSGENSVRNSVKSGSGGGSDSASATLLTKEKDTNSEQTTQTNANAEKVVHIIDTEIYESVDSSIDENNGSNNNANNNLTKDVKNKHNSEIRISSGSNRKSSESSKNSKSKDFNTDHSERERSQSLSINHNSVSKTGSKITGPKTTTGQFQQPLFMEQERKLSIDSESSSITSSKENISDGKSKKRKNKPFGGFFHKMFHKSKKSKDKNAPNSTGNLVITGPIDLRSLHSDSALNRPTNLSIDEARKNNSLTRNASPGNTEEQNVIDELKVKVERNHHALPLTSVADHILSKVAQQNEGDDEGEADNNTKKSAIVHRSNTITNTCRPKIPQKPKISPTINNVNVPLVNASQPVAATPTDENNDLFLAEPVVVHRRKNSQSEDFQQKLAKFNRLSERLSSTFATALTSTPSTQYQGIGRSRSFKVQKGRDDCLPPLPPKKKNSTSSNAEKNFYDYPTNNRPVPPVKKVKGSAVPKNKEDATTEQVPDDKNDNEVDSTISKGSTFIRSLHKKNSAPDILFPSSNSGSGDSERNSKEGETDNVFEEILCPPPIPPKVKSNPNLGSPSLPVRSISPTPVIQEYHVPSSSKPVKAVEPPVLICDVKSSPTDNKTDVAIKPPDIHKTSDTLTPAVAGSTMTPITSKPETQVVPAQQSSETKEDAKSITIVQEQKTAMEKNAVYQNLKFATMNTLVQEYETVEETEDEIAEMYDDFPSEYSGGSHTYESIDSPLPQEHSTNFTTTPKLIRHSGMDELQTFLNSEITSSSPPNFVGPNPTLGSAGEYSFPTEKAVFHHYDNVDEGDDVFDTTKKLPPTPTQMTIRSGAVSRLGHSSAIDQLKKMVNN